MKSTPQFRHCLSGGLDDRDALSLYFARGVGMALGATHSTINAMGSKLGPIDAHLRVLAMVAEALDVKQRDR